MNLPQLAVSGRELEQFEDFAASARMEGHAMDACTLQGMAAALAIAPKALSPTQWLPWVWDLDAGVRPPAFASIDEANAIIALVMRQYNAAVEAFEHMPVNFEPLFRREARWGAAEFCQGFMIGVELALDDWAPLEAANPRALHSLRTLAAGETDDIRRLGSDEIGALIDDIEPSLQAIHSFWLSGARAGDEPEPDVWQRVRTGLESLAMPFPAAAVELAEAHRDEVAPRLVQVLVGIAEDPTQALDSDYTLHLFAMHLLAGWRDRRAFAPLLALGHLHDPDLIDGLFGDLVSESYGRCLASVSGGDVAPMMALADDALADIWVRSAVLSGMTACVIEGEADRERIVAYLQAAADREVAALRSGRPAHAQGFEPIDAIVAELTNLCATDSLPAIRGWFAEGLLDTQFCDLEFVERHIVEPPVEAGVRMLKRRQGYVADAASEMSGWYMFDPKSRRRDGDAMPVSMPPRPPLRKQPKTGRNDPCPCGSGRKYKKCHGGN